MAYQPKIYPHKTDEYFERKIALIRSKREGIAPMLTLEQFEQLRGSSITMTNEKFMEDRRNFYKKQNECIVYIFWGNDGRALYVGRSYHGLERPFGPCHRIYRARLIFSVESFEYFHCENTGEADKLELQLIRLLWPVHNKRR